MLQQFLFGFQGRVGRQVWWLVSLGAMFLASLLSGVLIIALEITGYGQPLVFSLLVLALVVATIWINIALTVKRWHDRGKSGLWIFILLVPLIGGIWTLIECGFLPGTNGPNKYDPPPPANADRAAQVFS